MNGIVMDATDVFPVYSAYPVIKTDKYYCDVKGPKTVFTVTIIQKREPSPEKMRMLRKIGKVTYNKKGEKEHVISITVESKLDDLPQKIYDVLKIFGLKDIPLPRDFSIIVQYYHILENYKKYLKEKGVSLVATFSYYVGKKTRIKVYTKDKTLADRLEKNGYKVKEIKMKAMKYLKKLGIESEDESLITVYKAEKQCVSFVAVIRSLEPLFSS